jgi:hypothetical protein
LYQRWICHGRPWLPPPSPPSTLPKMIVSVLYQRLISLE